MEAPAGGPTDDLTDDLLAAQDGDRRALAGFIRATQPDVWRLSAHLVSPAEADDVTQDVYLRMWKALPQYRADAPARAWLLGIARRACADAVRGLERRRRLPLVLGHPGPPPVSDPAVATWLHDLVGQLPPRLREAFVLTQIADLSYAEAADLCGCPVGTIRSRVARARADLVARITADEAGPEIIDLTELEAPPARPVGYEL